VSSEYWYGNVVLSPSGDRVAFALYLGTLAYDSSVMRTKDGTRIQLPGGFVPQGWLDENTVIGSQWTMKNGQLQLPVKLAVNALDPLQEEELAVSGQFLGELRSK
jgi:hypothetical protein